MSWFSCSEQSFVPAWSSFGNSNNTNETVINSDNNNGDGTTSSTTTSYQRHDTHSNTRKDGFNEATTSTKNVDLEITIDVGIERLNFGIFQVQSHKNLLVEFHAQ